MKRYLEFYYSGDPYNRKSKGYICLDVMEHITTDNMLDLMHNRKKPLHNMIDAFFHGLYGYVNEVKIPDDYLIDSSLTYFVDTNLKESPIYVTDNTEDSDYMLSWKVIYDSGIIDTHTLLIYHFKCTFDVYEKTNLRNYKNRSVTANKILKYYKFDSNSTYLFMLNLISMGLESVACKAFKNNPNLSDIQIHKLLATMNDRIINYPKLKNKKFISNELYDLLNSRVNSSSRWNIRDRALKFKNIELNHAQILKSLSKHELKRLQNINPSRWIEWCVGSIILKIAINMPLNKNANESDIKFINKLLDNNIYEVSYNRISIQ